MEARAGAADVDDEERVALDLRFHSLIARAANNEVFVHMLKQLRETLLLQLRLVNSVGDSRASLNAQHERIVAAIEGRDATAAASAMTEYLDHVQSALASLSPTGEFVLQAISESKIDFQTDTASVTVATHKNTVINSDNIYE